ncbi:hypothetical protein GFC30_1784 [Anoxybacillus amylolyticus]|uniref:Uncharacterized protein n=1 Tax=Anoxybacteroides amylolyticum TaxID=294699 RepID=A0A160F5J7_9BACL|nr:hypothetical protein GFC30_1784 [Anoxybacillus amylolyticus]
MKKEEKPLDHKKTSSQTQPRGYGDKKLEGSNRPAE